MARSKASKGKPAAQIDNSINEIEGLPEANRFMPSLIRVHSLIVKRFERICGIHIGRWRLLYGVARAGQIVQAELAASTTIEQAVVTRTFSDFERKGFVARNPDPTDGRKLLVSLTPSGIELIKNVAERRAKFLELALQGISKKDLETLETLLHRIEQNLQDE
ncbi:MAG: winged helix-turn-helix transcriptional regulator [Sphingomonadales bacterium]|nr:winged helix-turn-helix transcriptional regulator [Sphingomonadales bacterium]